MASARLHPPSLDPPTGGTQGLVPDLDDDDDSIHIASVTRIEDATGSFLQVVVAWREGERWAVRVVRMPTETATPTLES